MKQPQRRERQKPKGTTRKHDKAQRNADRQERARSPHIPGSAAAGPTNAGGWRQAAQWAGVNRGRPD